MRLFIAISVTKEVKDYLNQLISELKRHTHANIKWVNNYHITLKFLGEVNSKQCNNIRKKLQEINFENFNLKLDKIGFFPNKDYIKIIWFGIKQEQKLLELHKEINQKIISKNKKHKKHKFHPHITLARIKWIRNKDSFLDNLEKIKFKKLNFEIKHFELIKSTLTSQGPIYEVINKFKGL